MIRIMASVLIINTGFLVPKAAQSDKYSKNGAYRPIPDGKESEILLALH